MPNILRNPKRAIFGSPTRSSLRSNQQQAAQGLAALRPGYTAQMQRGTAGVNAVAPLRDAGFNRAFNYLSNDTGGDALDTARLAQGAGRVADGTDNALARYSAMMRQKGITGGAEAGGSAAILNGGQRAMSGLETGVYTDSLNRRRGNLLAASNLANNQYGQNLAEESRGLAGLSSNYGQEFGMLGNLAAQEEAAKNAYNNNILGTVAGLGGLIGQFGGRRNATMSGQNAPGGGRVVPTLDGLKIVGQTAGGALVYQDADGTLHTAQEYPG